MICQNCQAEVDNDLVFCTECGSRLHQTISNAQTVVMPESVVTKVSETIPQKKSSSLKWVALAVGIVVIIAVPASLFIAYFALNKNNSVSNKSSNNSSINKKTSNQNKTANVVNKQNSETDWSNKTQNKESNVLLKPKETKIIDEQINVDANSNIAFPFKVREGMVKLDGETEILNGDQFEGFVFLQEVYDENGVNPNKKIFSFDTDKAEQYLPKGNYVLVFVNGDGKGVSLKTRFTLTPQDSAEADKN